MSALIWQKENGNFQLWTYFAETAGGHRPDLPRTFCLVGGHQDESATGGGGGGRQGGLKITSTLGGNHSVSPRRHGALKYERYDGSRLFLSLSLSLLSLPLRFLTPFPFPSSRSPMVH